MTEQVTPIAVYSWLIFFSDYFSLLLTILFCFSLLLTILFNVFFVLLKGKMADFPPPQKKNLYEI